MANRFATRSHIIGSRYGTYNVVDSDGLRCGVSLFHLHHLLDGIEQLIKNRTYLAERNGKSVLLQQGCRFWGPTYQVEV